MMNRETKDLMEAACTGDALPEEGGASDGPSGAATASAAGSGAKGKRPVSKLGLDLTLIETYPSITAAARAVGLKTPSSLAKACRNGTSSAGFFWCYADRPFPGKSFFSQARPRIGGVVAIDPATRRIIASYRDIAEAEVVYGPRSYSGIYRAMRSKTDYKGKFFARGSEVPDDIDRYRLKSDRNVEGRAVTAFDRDTGMPVETWPDAFEAAVDLGISDPYRITRALKHGLVYLDRLWGFADEHPYRIDVAGGGDGTAGPVCVVSVNPHTREIMETYTSIESAATRADIPAEDLNRLLGSIAGANNRIWLKPSGSVEEGQIVELPDDVPVCAIDPETHRVAARFETLIDAACAFDDAEPDDIRWAVCCRMSFKGSYWIPDDGAERDYSSYLDLGDGFTLLGSEPCFFDIRTVRSSL